MSDEKWESLGAYQDKDTECWIGVIKGIGNKLLLHGPSSDDGTIAAQRAHEMAALLRSKHNAEQLSREVDRLHILIGQIISGKHSELIQEFKKAFEIT
jgi:hypothetical protein